MLRTVISTAAAAAALALASGTAVAGPAPTSADTPHEPLADITLTIYDADGATSAGPPVIAEATLECTPDEGTHPTPVQACDSLRGAGGDFERLPTIDAACTGVHAPVRVVAEGYWQSTPMGPARLVDFERTYTNRCWAEVRTDNVFRL